MVRRLISHRPRLMACLVLAALAIALPAAAQSTGMVKGNVRDEQGQPVDGAKISIDQTSANRHFETKSDKKGEFIQIGLAPGPYKVTAEKEKVGTDTATLTVRIGGSPSINLVLKSGAAGPAMSKEAAAKIADLKKFFDEGVAASNAGNHDDAIAKFTQATAIKPDCYDCFYNIGFAQAQKKDYAAAEGSYKKAIEIKADYGEAYNGLANIYNAQKKFDEAAVASAKATEFSGGGGALVGGGGSADALFNQGVILWNGGKIAEAKKMFESAIQSNPNHAEAHYQLGMSLVNEGNLAGAAAEFETYLKLAPTGPNAAQAKALVAQLKK